MFLVPDSYSSDITCARCLITSCPKGVPWNLEVMPQYIVDIGGRKSMSAGALCWAVCLLLLGSKCFMPQVCPLPGLHSVLTEPWLYSLKNLGQLEWKVRIVVWEGVGRCRVALHLVWWLSCLGWQFVLALCFFLNCLFSLGSAVSFPFSVLIVNLILNVLSSCTFLLAHHLWTVLPAAGLRPPSWLSRCQRLSSSWPALPCHAFPGLIIVTPLLLSLFWCLLILSFCLNGTGLGLSKIKSWCFVTAPAHWHVGGTLSEQNVHNRRESNRCFFSQRACVLHFDPFYSSVRVIPTEFHWPNHLVILECISRYSLSIVRLWWANPGCLHGP